MSNTTNPINQLTSNQYYRGVNRRYDKRVKRLLSIGFRFVHNEFGSFLVKGTGQKPRVLANTFIMAASSRQYYDRLCGILQHG